MENILYCALGVLALLFRYYLGETQACKVIGVEISDTGTKTGFQDAISIPSSTKITLTIWAFIIICLGYLAYEFGWGSFGVGILVFFVVSLIAGAVILPKAGSDHFLKRIYVSMDRRYADYEKSNDIGRAAAMKVLLERVVSTYGDRVKHLD